MKFILRLLILSSISLLFVSCEGVMYEEKDPEEEKKEALAFAKGGDISLANLMNAEGYKFYNEKNKEKECAELLKSIGFNAVRLRAKVNPEGGWCNADDVLKQARKAKEQNLRIMIAFLYSDDETDTAQQAVPAEWQKYNLSQMTEAVRTHTRQVLKKLKDEGIDVDWVQIGNETVNGMLGSVGAVTEKSASAFCELFSAASKVAKNLYPEVLIVLHPGSGWENSKAEKFIDLVKAENLEYDMLGLSLFPVKWNKTQEVYEKWEGPFASFLNELYVLHEQSGKDCLLCEFGMPQVNAKETSDALASLISNTSNKKWFKGVFYKEPESEPFRSHGYRLGAFSGGKPTVALAPFNPGRDEADTDPYGIRYMYDESVLPEIHLNVSLLEWNKLLGYYDKNNRTKQYVKADMKYIKGDDVTEIKEIGIRLRGRASRRRPEGNTGEMHSSSSKLRRCHLGLNFRKYVKDDAHELHGARGTYLRYNGGDGSYIHEVYSYDLFRRTGVFTGINAVHCRVWLKIAGDAKETYMGVYTMAESVDERYVKARAAEFGGGEGNLWKCRHKIYFTLDDPATYGRDTGTDQEYNFELKSDDNDFVKAQAQLKGFIRNYNTLTGDEFKNWVKKVMDVEFFLRTYAVNVSLGMWDDYWANRNNCYIYFNSTDQNNYKFYFIPYDYDHSMGESASRGGLSDTGKHDPFNWGYATQPLVYKLLQYPEFREMYRQALLELVEPQNGYLYYTSSIQRIKAWQSRIKSYVSNDTGSSSITDRPGGNHPEYRLLDTGDNNFFKVKAASIHKYCDE